MDTVTNSIFLARSTPTLWLSLACLSACSMQHVAGDSDASYASAPNTKYDGRPLGKEALDKDASEPTCSPRATPVIQPRELNVYLPEWSKQNACSLDTETYVSNQGTNRHTRYMRTGNTITELVEGLRSAEYTVDSHDRITRHVTFNKEGKQQLMHAVTYDADGHAVRLEEWGGTITTQTFDGDRLIRTERHSGERGDLDFEHDFSYDSEGRLIEAKAKWGTYGGAARTRRSVWSYTPEGHPSELTSYLDGTLVNEISWSWDADGELVSRKHQQHASSLSIGCYEQVLPLLHQYEAAIIFSCVGMRQPTEKKDCDDLPVAASWNYPEAEYQISEEAAIRGLSLAGMPQLVQHDQTPSYYYSYYTAAGASPQTTWSTDYDKGRMVREIRETPDTVEQEAIRSTRTRTISGRKVVKDELSVNAGPADSLGVLTLHWNYDDQGRMVEVRLDDATDTVFRGRQTWQGDLLTTINIERNEDGLLQSQSRDSRSFDPQGRLVSRRWESPTLVASQEVTYDYDDGTHSGTLVGTRVERRGFAPHTDPLTSVQYNLLNEQEKPLLLRIDHESDGEWDRIESWNYDEHGNAIDHQLWYTSNYGPVVREFETRTTRSFVCN